MMTLLVPFLINHEKISPKTQAAHICPLEVVPTNFMNMIGGYVPNEVALSSQKPVWVNKVPAGVTNPQFGSITYQGHHYTFVLQRLPDNKSQLWFDSNGDGDLTNDPSPTWNPKIQSASSGGANASKLSVTNYFGGATMEIDFKGNSTKVHIGVYAFDARDPNRAKLANDLLVYNDFGFKSHLTFAGNTYPVLLGDSTITGFSPTSNGIAQAMIGIDRDNDGNIRSSAEQYFGKNAINIDGTILKFASVDLTQGTATFEPSTEEVAEIAMPKDFSVGHPAISFTAKTMDGKTVHFPQDYKGKVAMLDFWATWCPPCREEIPYSTAAYKKYHASGFDILGVSLDQAKEAKLVTDFTAKNSMTWPQIYEGKFWDVSLVKTYSVQGIPFVILVDGTSGKIIATEEQLRGDALDKTIQNAVGYSTKQ